VNFRWTFTFCVEEWYGRIWREFDRRCHFKHVSLKQSRFYYRQTSTAHRQTIKVDGSFATISIKNFLTSLRVMYLYFPDTTSTKKRKKKIKEERKAKMQTCNARETLAPPTFGFWNYSYNESQRDAPFLKFMWEIVHLVGFHYKNTSRWTVLWMPNSETMYGTTS
jgi:hypothetical protein